MFHWTNTVHGLPLRVLARDYEIEPSVPIQVARAHGDLAGEGWRALPDRNRQRCGSRYGLGQLQVPGQTVPREQLEARWAGQPAEAGRGGSQLELGKGAAQCGGVGGSGEGRGQGQAQGA